MHCIGAELQGEHDGRVRGVQGLHFWHLVVSWCMIVRDASDPWCEFTAEGAIDPSGKCPTYVRGYPCSVLKSEQ